MVNSWNDSETSWVRCRQGAGAKPAYRPYLPAAMFCLLLALPAVPCLLPDAAPPNGDDAVKIRTTINSGQHAVLCPNTTWHIKSTIKFDWNIHDIYILTEGQPRDGSRASLVLDASLNPDLVTVVQANEGQTAVQLRNVIVDGGESAYGHSARAAMQPCGGALLCFGGPGNGQIIDSVKAFDTRGWTTIVLEQGNPPYCRFAQITNNEFGPAGRPEAGLWADGISLQCFDSDVLYNLITDATDGGIVIFGAAGSTIRYNTIRTISREAISGIAMVDYGDYTQTFVFGNTIEANQYMRIGVAMGGYLQGDCRQSVVSGGHVFDNALIGNRMGYGFVADGVTNWLADFNSDYATHLGSGVGCGGAQLPTPRGFVKHATHASGVFQSQFRNVSALHNAGAIHQ